MKIEHEGHGQYGELAKIRIFRPSYLSALITRCHPLAPDNTFLQLKGFDKIPTDKREIRVKALTIMP